MTRVIWSPIARVEWENTVRYLYHEFGMQIVKRFEQNTLKWEQHITTFPESGKQEPLLRHHNQNYRSIVVHKHCKLIYRFEEDIQTIHIIDFWDTRREPKELEARVK